MSTLLDLITRHTDNIRGKLVPIPAFTGTSTGTCCSGGFVHTSQQPAPRVLAFQVSLAGSCTRSRFWDAPRRPLHVADWVPRQSPRPGDNFLGVDRTLDPTRMAGFRLLSFGPGEDTITERLHTLARNVIRVNGGLPSAALVSPATAQLLPSTLTLRAGGMNLSVRVVGDASVTSDDDAWLLELDTWRILSDGPVPESGEGVPAQLVCDAPSRNGYVSLVGVQR